MNYLRQIGIAVSLCVGAEMPAHAANYLITYTGTVISGIDETGEFAGPGTDLAGLPFTSAYTFTYPLAGVSELNDGTQANALGGYQFAAPNPVSAVLSINGVSRSFGNSGNTFGIAYQTNGFYGYDQVYHRAEDSTFAPIQSYNFVSNSVINYDFDLVDSLDLTKALTYTVKPGDVTFGEFQVLTYNFPASSYIANASGNLAATSVTIIRAVPEPKSWAMLIIGFGTVGASMRRRASNRAFLAA